jgi:hypothetical protein
MRNGLEERGRYEVRGPEGEGRGLRAERRRETGQGKGLRVEG